MSLKEDLKKCLVESAKAKDQVRLDTIRSVQSAIHYKEIDKRGELEESEVQSVIAGLCKKHRESIEQFQKGGRQDLVEKETRELGILQAFLPKALSDQEVESIIQKIVGELNPQGPQDMGRVMKGVMKELAGKADGRLVSTIVNSLLKK